MSIIVKNLDANTLLMSGSFSSQVNQNRYSFRFIPDLKPLFADPPKYELSDQQRGQ